MVTRRAFLGILGSASAAAAGVAAGVALLQSDGDAAPDLPSIVYGQETCARCRMVIDDARFAAAWIDEDGEERHFDDIGCAALDVVQWGLSSGARVFVHDFSSEEWLDARTAHYVQTGVIRTPMDYGVVAVSDATAAEHLAHKSGGSAMAWHTLPDALHGAGNGDHDGAHHGQGG